ncbi:hypothetical protein ACRRTK_013387 [Alexandromys fortis]
MALTVCLFLWPHYGSPLAGESLSVQVVNCSRVFSPRPLGTLVISLQQLQSAGHLVLREALVDEKLRVSPIQVELDLKYQPPEGAAGTWAEEDFGTPIRDSSELIIPNVGFQELDHTLGLPRGDLFQVCRAQDFQVGVTVLEAQKLVGVNINPYVAVRVGDQRRVTTTQRGTNCPFYNEVSTIKEEGEPEIMMGTSIKSGLLCMIPVTPLGDQGLRQDHLVCEGTNLLLPRGVQAERPWARLRVRVYRAEGLPTVRTGLLGNLARALHDQHVLLDPYVRVSFLGQQAEFKPTFGPAWVPLYGSLPSGRLWDGLQSLNEGTGEGIWFRGRLLVAVSMEVLEGRVEPKSPQTTQGSRLSRLAGKKKKKKTKQDETPAAVLQPVDASARGDAPEIPSAMEVEVEELLPLPEHALASCEDFLLFAVVFEATMIDPSLAKQPISLEISIGSGHAGRREEQLGQRTRTVETQDSILEAQPLLGSEDRGSGQEEEELLGTPAQWPEPVDGNGQFCLGAERRTMTRPNALDRCRGKLLSHSLPQPSLPDVLVWMFSGQRRVAYARLPAQDVLFSKVEEERGRDCGKIQSLLLTAPGAAPGEVFAKLELFLWLGLAKQAKTCTSELPPDLLPEPSAGLPHSLYRDDFSYFQLRAHLYQARGVLAADDSGLSDPFARVLISTQCQTTRGYGRRMADDHRETPELDTHAFGSKQLKHLFDCPLACVGGPLLICLYLFFCMVLKVLEQTLSPLWDELLVFDQLIVDGRRELLQEEPPLVVINVFDHNKFGPSVFLGRALAAPRVKLIEDPYQRPELQFFPLRKGSQTAGEVIATFELIELDYSGRFEVLFWGLRGLGRVHLFEVERPQVVLEVAGRRLESEVLASYRENPNFTELVQHVTVPPLSIVVIERRAFGRTVLVGSHIVSNMLQFTLQGREDPPEEEEPEEDTRDLVPKGPQGEQSRDPFGAEAGLSSWILKAPLKKLTLGLLGQGPELEEDIPDPEEMDWWSKYYALLQELHGQSNFDEDEMEDAGDPDSTHLISADREAQEQGRTDTKVSGPRKKAIATLKIYNNSLEEEFNHFEDWLNVFPLYEGQGGQAGDGEEGSGHFVGKFKGSFLIYPESEAASFSEPQISRGIPQNRPIKLLVRVYVVKATNLTPADPNGKADPYVVVSTGKEQRDTKERYIPKQLHPIFGEDGYNAWRDAFRPSQILAGLCQRCGLPAPEYRAGAVKVDNRVFLTPSEALPSDGRDPKVKNEASEEAQALLVLRLRRWQEMPGLGIQLVPEHVETRHLYHPRSPGLLQGSLHMWIDIFPSDVPAPPPVDIKPLQPIRRDVERHLCEKLDKGLEHDKQETDVHFNSLTGEGNFNWRFVFRFDYLPTEREVSVRRKPGPFALEEAEFRQPAVLVMQVWDYDRISANDFLGALELQLPDMGKVEAEFELLTVEEAENRPVGKGRKEPEPLEKPNRPKTSFNWFVNPLKTFVFFIWRRHWRILVLLLLLALITVFLLLVFYTIPGQISEVIFQH